MSITRQLLHEFRPLFRMLEEPFSRGSNFLAPMTNGTHYRYRNQIFGDPLGDLNMLARPALDVTEKGNRYILEADLPGVSRENIQVRLGDGNQSITIEGKVTERSSSGVQGKGAATKSDALDAGTPSDEYTDASHSTSATIDHGDATQIFIERPYARNFSYTRTVWLPRPVDPSNVTAKLQNGVLSVILNKRIDDESKVISVEEA